MYPLAAASVFFRLAFTRVSVFVASVASAALVVTLCAPLNVTVVAGAVASIVVALANVVLSARVASWASVIPPLAVIVPARVRVAGDVAIVDGKLSAPFVTVKLSPAPSPRARLPVVVIDAVFTLVAPLKFAFPALTVRAFVTVSGPDAVYVPLPFMVKL